MMRYLLFFVILIVLASCKGGTGKTEKTDSATAVGLQPIVNNGGTNIDSANETGDRLIAANDCLTCHQINTKGFGPSYLQVANRYENNEGNVANLADKIRKGGRGLWGQNYMTPHPTVSDKNARIMVRYILSLRNTSADSAK